MPRLKNRINEAHLALHNYMKGKALALESGHSNELQVYLRDQKKFSNRPFKICQTKTLLKRVSKSDIIFIGDFHTFDQNSRNLERMLREMDKNSDKYALAMEMVFQEDQEIVNSFLKGIITENEFLEDVEYHESWRFPWHHYRPFFIMAKKRKIRIIALNSKGNLKQRDTKAAKIITSSFATHPNEKLFILFGELHLMPNKLPAMVKKIKENLTITTVHQNLDNIYWELASKNKLKTDRDLIVKYSDEEYCIQTSPPWIKYESMIYWHENLHEDPDYDLHESLLEYNNRNFTENVHDQFVYLCSNVINTLGIDSPKLASLEDFNLYDHNKLSYVLNRLNGVKSTGARNYYLKMVLHGKLLKLPKGQTYYCSSYSINRLATLAGLHIRTILCGSDVEDKILQERCSKTTVFHHFLMNEIASYLASKLVNPFRKCDMYQEIILGSKERTNSDKKHFKYSLELISILKKNDLKALEQALKGKNTYFLGKVTRLLGPLFGELIHLKLLRHSDITQDIVTIFYTSQFVSKNFVQYLSQVIKKSKIKTRRKRTF